MKNKNHVAIRLVIADDHIVVREGLVSLLNDEPDIQVLGQAGSGQEAVAQARKYRPDIILLDISMPDLNGLEATRMIKTELPHTKILILTMHDQNAFFFEALRAGASGYILKGSRSEKLLDAIRDVHSGGIYLSPELAGGLVQDYIQRNPEPLENDPLTEREREVLSLIAQGLTNSEIAEKLTLSVNTVKTHRLHIYRKLELRNRSELIDYALRHGLLGV